MVGFDNLAYNKIYSSRIINKNTMNNPVQQLILEIIEPIIKLISPEAKIEFNKEGDQWRILIIDGNPELIGEKGEVLRAIQHLARIFVHKKLPEDRTHFLIDIDNFRSNRELIIKTKIPEIAQAIIAQGKTFVLINLSGYERMLVHKLLVDIKSLQTTSVGERDNRKLLILPTSEAGSAGIDDATIWDINKESAK